MFLMNLLGSLLIKILYVSGLFIVGVCFFCKKLEYINVFSLKLFMCFLNLFVSI